MPIECGDFTQPRSIIAPWIDAASSTSMYAAKNAASRWAPWRYCVTSRQAPQTKTAEERSRYARFHGPGLPLT